MGDTIDKEKILAVEGQDEKNFFTALLKHIDIPASEFAIHDIGGKDQFKHKLPALVKVSGFFETVKTLVVIRDAEDNADTTFESIKDILKKQNLEPPGQKNQFSEGNPKVGIFIMPGNYDKGMLEDLCLKTVENHPGMKCVEAFIDCVSGLESPPKNIAKAKVQAFLAAMPNIANCIGIGAQKGYWDFDSEALKDLKSFLSNILND